MPASQYSNRVASDLRATEPVNRCLKTEGTLRRCGELCWPASRRGAVLSTVCPDLSSTAVQIGAPAADTFERSTPVVPTTRVICVGSRLVGCATPATGGRKPNGNSQPRGLSLPFSVLVLGLERAHYTAALAGCLNAGRLRSPSNAMTAFSRRCFSAHGRKVACSLSRRWRRGRVMPRISRSR
jgi:hypothetical protein